MANMLFKIGLWGLGLSAILIGGALAFFGSHAVANFFASAIRVFHDVDVISDFEQGLDEVTFDAALWTGLTSAEDVLAIYGSIETDRATIDFGDGNILHIDGISDYALLALDINLF